MLRRLQPCWRHSAGAAAAGIALFGLAALVELAYPWPVKVLVDYVFTDRAPTALLDTLWPAFGSGDKSGMVAGICLAIALIAATHQALLLGSRYLVIGVGNRTVRELRGLACEHLHRLELAFHQRTRLGDSIQRIAYDTQGAMTMIAQGIAPAAAAVVLLTGALAVLLWLDWLLALCLVAAAPALWLLIRAFGKRIERRAKSYHDNESLLVSNLQESLSAIAAVQAFGREPEAVQSLSARAEASVRANQRLVLTQLWFGAAVSVALAAGTAAVVGIGAHRVLAQHLTVGDVLVFLGYLGLLYQPVSALTQSAAAIAASRTQLGRVFEVLDRVPEVGDRPGASAPASVRGAVSLREVTFAHEPGRVALHNVDLEIEPGSVVALVGPTGAGKSTLASLLLRFHDPTAGSVRLDGSDLRDLPLAWLRAQVSVVLQDTVLFSATVAENIRYACPGASRAATEEAARLAQADAFIRELPDGYDTVLGERGANLSAGQRQRLAIARAFLKNAPLLVLDEPTSSLDVATEAALLDALERLVRGRTTILIAHRLATLRLADEIVVLERGRIVERGSHDALLRDGRAYRRLWDTQAGKNVLGAELPAES